VGTLEGVAYRIARLLPGQPRAAAAGIPARARPGLEAVAPRGAAGLLAHFQAVAVGRGVVAVVLETGIGVRAVGVLGAPVLRRAGHGTAGSAHADAYRV